MKYVSTWLIANNLDVEFESSFRFASDLIFRRAYKYEIEKYRLLIERYVSGDLGWITPFEINWIPQENGSGFTGTRIEDKKLWKYWVITDVVGGTKAYKLQKILNLASPELDLSIRLMFQLENGKRFEEGYSPALHHIGEKHWGMVSRNLQPSLLTRDTLKDSKRLFENFESLTDQHIFVEKSLTKFHDLRRLPPNSDLRTVGYFSVIEGLTTHSPRLNESLDSITHQLRSKIILLNKRFDVPIDMGATFEGVSEKKLWTKLYAYRSSIAHGGIPDFQKEFSVLNDRSTVNSFLHNVCKSLLRFGLCDPELLEDLKEC